MLTFKKDRKTTDTAVILLASLCAIGSAVLIFSLPFLAPAALASLGAFFATFPGIFISILVCSLLLTLAFGAIVTAFETSKNRSTTVKEKMDGKIVVDSAGCLQLKVTDEALEFLKENNQNKNQDDSVIPDEYRIDFLFNDKSYYITAKDESGISGNNRCLKINSLAVKNDRGEFKLIDGSDQQLKTLSLGSEENDAKELTIELTPSSIVKSPEAEQQKNERSLSN